MLAGGRVSPIPTVCWEFSNQLSSLGRDIRNGPSIKLRNLSLFLCVCKREDDIGVALMPVSLVLAHFRSYPFIIPQKYIYMN